MSVDYGIYINGKFPTELLSGIHFVKESGVEPDFRGNAFDGCLFVYFTDKGLSSIFTEEELGFVPTAKIILSPNMDAYEKSMTAIVDVINMLIRTSCMLSLYQSNEILLLQKNSSGVFLYNEFSWWDEYFDLLDFNFTNA